MRVDTLRKEKKSCAWMSYTGTVNDEEKKKTKQKKRSKKKSTSSVNVFNVFGYNPAKKKENVLYNCLV